MCTYICVYIYMNWNIHDTRDLNCTAGVLYVYYIDMYICIYIYKYVYIYICTHIYMY